MLSVTNATESTLAREIGHSLGLEQDRWGAHVMNDDGATSWYVSGEEAANARIGLRVRNTGTAP